MCWSDSDPCDGFGVEWSGLLSQSHKGLAAGGRYPGANLLYSQPWGQRPQPQGCICMWPGPLPRKPDRTPSVSGVLIVSCKGLFFSHPLWCWNGSQGLVCVRHGALSDVGAISPLSYVLALCRFCNGNKSRYYLHCERKREIVFRSSSFSSHPVVCSSQAPSV